MKYFMLYQAGVGLLGALLAFQASGLMSAASIAIGCAVILVNVGLTAVLWKRLIQKKLIALSLAIIIFKYAILGAIIYKLLSLSWIEKGWLCAGFGSLVITAPLYALFAPNQEGKE